MSDRDILTEKDKEFIVANYASMSILQMAIRLNIKTENRKCPIIEEFVKQSKIAPPTPTVASGVGSGVAVNVKVIPDIKEIAQQITESPSTTTAQVDDSPDAEDASVEAFAQYLRDIGFGLRDAISERERRDINFLLAQLSSTRFLLMYKALRGKDYKKLFKEEFAKSMYGKGEMPTEEVNDFMDLANETVFQHDTKCKIRDLETMRDRSETSTAQKLVLEQVVGDLNKLYGESVKRGGEIKKTLGAHREQRLKENRAVGLTITLLLEAVYNTEKREELVKLQGRTDDKLQKVISELEALGETKAMILGISPEDLKAGGL